MNPTATPSAGAPAERPSTAIPCSPDPGGISVSASPHPFRLERVNMIVPAGLSVAAILAHVQPDPALRAGACVRIGGREVPESLWNSVRPKHGHLVEISIMLHGGGGGGGKNPLRTVLQIAIMAAAPYASAALLSGTLFASAATGLLAGRLLTAGIGLVANLALSALSPPSSPKIAQLSGSERRESQHYFIEGARNRIRKFEPVPRVFGRHRMYADMSARAFTENAGDDQYLWAQFTWGYGPLRLSDFRIGETPIELFEGVEIEHREGFADDPPFTITIPDVTEEALSIELDVEGSGPGAWQTRTTEPDTDEFSVDIAFPRGVVTFNAEGNRVNRTVELEARYAPAGTEDWTIYSDGKIFNARQVTIAPVPPANKRNNQIFERWASVIMDRYDGRLEVIYGSSVLTTSPAALKPPVPAHKWALCHVLMQDDTAAIDAGMIVDARTSAAPTRLAETDFAPGAPGGLLVSIAGGTLYYNGLRVTERRGSEFRRTLRFKPPSRGQYDVQIRRITAKSASDRVFDDSFWVRLRSIKNEETVTLGKSLAQTRLRIKASGQLNGVIDQLNCIAESVLPVWDGATWDNEEPTSNPASVFLEILTGAANPKPQPEEMISRESIEAFFEDCTEHGWAFNSVIDYPSSVGEMLHDAAAAGRAFWHRPDGRFTVALERPQSVPVQHFTPRNTWGFEGEISYPDLPHGLRIRFSNEEKAWEQDERLVFADGFDAETADRYEEMDLAGITNPDLAWKHGRYHMAVAYKRREFFSFWADFETLQCTRGDLVYLSHDVPQFGLAAGRVKSVSDNGTHAVSVTLDEEVTMEAALDYVIRFRLQSGASLLAAVTTQEGEGLTELVFADSLLLALAPQPGDLFMFGEADTEILPVLVQRIERGKDLTARLTCVAYAPEVYQADQGAIPGFTSALSGAASPASPDIIDVRSDGAVLYRDPDGSLVNRILIRFRRPSALFTGIEDAQARFRESGSDGPWTYVFSDADQGELSLAQVEAGIEYEYQLRWLLGGGPAGAWTDAATHIVVGKEAPPGNVTRLAAQQNGDTITITFTAAPDLDLKGTEIRYIKSA